MFKPLAYAFFLFFNLVAVNALAQAQSVYQPLEFFDTTLKNRNDIRDTYKKLQVTKTTITATNLKAISLQSAKATYFDEIADLLEATASSPLPPVVNESDQCASHIVFSKKALPKVEETASCQPLKTQMQNLFNANFAASCRSILEPELQLLPLLNSPIDKEKIEGQLQTLEGAIQFAVLPLLAIDVPGNVLTNEAKQKLRDIYLKLNINKVQTQITQKIETYSQLLKTLQNQSHCLVLKDEPKKIFLAEVASLVDEIYQQHAYVTDLNTRGLQQAQQDQKKILEQKRKRTNLPFANLSDVDRQNLSLFLGGMYWRFRGGGALSLGSTRRARFLFNRLPMELIAQLNGGNQAKVIGTRINDRISKGWGEYMDMGTTPGDKDRVHDVVMMMNRGLYQVESAASELRSQKFDNTNLLAGGMQMGICYYYSVEKLINFHLGRPMPAPFNSSFIDGFTASGEFCTGAAISLGLSKSLLAGSL